MALPSNIKLKEKEVSQTIDLEAIAGVDLSNDPALKESIGQALIDFMVERTKSGKDIDKIPFRVYPKSYKESDQYSAFSKSSDVNLSLTGNMLSDIDILSTSGNTIKIGMGSTVNNAKAYNHMKGDTVKKREWFGLREKDINEVLDSFADEIKAATDEPTDEISQFIKNIRTGTATAITPEVGQSVTISIRDLFGED